MTEDERVTAGMRRLLGFARELNLDEATLG